jgi:hypothetical protein
MSAILKEDYEGPIRDQTNNLIVLYDRFLRAGRVTNRGVQKTTTGGLEVYVPLRTGRNHGIGARPTVGALLPTAGHQSFGAAKYNVTQQLGRLELELSVIKAAQRDVDAFTDAVDAEMDGLANDMAYDMNRQILGDGSGILTICGTTTASTTVTVTDTGMLEVGMIIDIRNTSTGAAVTNGTEVEILTIPSTTTFTVSLAVTTSSSHAIYRAGARDASGCYEIFGIDYVIDNANGSYGQGNYGQISRSAAAYWKGNVLGNSGTLRTLTTRLMRDALNEAEVNGGKAGRGISVIVTTHEIAAVYGEMNVADKRYPGSPGKPEMKFDAGWTNLQYAGKDILADKHCKDNKMYFLDESCLAFYHEGDWEWMDDDGAVLSRVMDRPAYEAVMYRFIQLGAAACNVHSVLEDIRHT